MKKPLVQSETAVKFINQMKLDVNRRVHLGDPTKHKTVLNYVTAAHTAMTQGIETIEALGGDMTRSEPERHDAGRKVAARTIEALQRSQASIRAAANNMLKEGNDAINAQFAPDPLRAGLDSEIRSWVRDKAKAGDVAAIKEQVKALPEVAAIIYHSPRFLLDLALDVHESFKLDAVEKYASQHIDTVSEGMELAKLADKYGPVIASINASFYNAAVAEQVKSRVEV